MLKTVKFVASHPMNRHRKVASIFGYLKWQIISRAQSEHVFNWIEDSQLVVANGMTGATGNIYCGLHEFNDKAFFLHVLREDDTFLDIGANVGSYSVLAGKVCGSKIIAFEPDEGTASSYERNMSANDISDYDLHRVALGPQDGSISFTIGLDTVNRVSDRDDLPTHKVPMKKLDDIPNATSATFIKMDVEGFEAKVLEGAEKVLNSPSLIALQTECDDPAVETILNQSGLFRYYYNAEDRTLTLEPDDGNKAANALFIKDKATVEARIASAPYRSFRGKEF
ncbi:MAG: FkbM family methyltransferase [Pseudomonadota bacterium]